MKLLFNIDNEDISGAELKELLGFVDADLTFKNLLPDIITSTNEVRKFIGKELYDLIHEEYESSLDDGAYENDYTDLVSNIIRSTRYPIALRAYSFYAPTNDLSHTNDGRRMRNSDNEKMAFEWMLTKDEKNQERRYYRALDDLIELLDDSKPDDYAQLDDAPKKETIYYNWINSESYKSLKGLFLNSVDDFNEVFTIESRLLLINLRTGISECERREILPRIGKDKMAALKQTASPEPLDLELIKLIKEASAFYALAWGIPRKSITMFPEGVLQFQVSDRMSMNAKKPAILNEHEYALQAFKESANNALLEIEALLAPIPEPIIHTQSVLRDICEEDKGFSAT